MLTLCQYTHRVRDDLDRIAGFTQSLNELRTEIGQLMRVTDGNRSHNVDGLTAAAAAQRRETAEVKTVL